MNKFIYAANCVGLDRRDAMELSDCIGRAKEITRKSFLRHVGAKQMDTIEYNLGYAHRNSRTALNMANDYHVSYYAGKMYGRRVYYFKWSAIEYIFTENGTLNR